MLFESSPLTDLCLFCYHNVLSKFRDPILLPSDAGRFYGLFWVNTHLSVRYLLPINMRKDLKRSVSQGKVGLPEHLSTLQRSHRDPIGLWRWVISYCLGVRGRYGRAQTRVCWGQQEPDLINRLWIRPLMTACMWAGMAEKGCGLWQDHCRERMMLYWGWKMELSLWNEWIVQFLFCNPGNN